MKKPMMDSAGTEIKVGDTVRQLNVFHAARGALYGNAGQTGTVVGFGRTRVKVNFLHREGSDGPITDSIHPDLVTVIVPAEQA